MLSVLSLAIAAGATLPEAAYLANTAAGVVVGKLGTASVSPAELAAALDEFHAIVGIWWRFAYGGKAQRLVRR